MAVVTELIRSEENGTISFGDYTLGAKSKLDNFEHAGDLYKVKTFGEITKLEKNGMFVYESVPGTAVTEMKTTEDGVEFDVEGMEDAEITLGLTEETEYNVLVDDKSVGQMKTNLGGKLTIGAELNPDSVVHIKVEKM